MAQIYEDGEMFEVDTIEIPLEDGTMMTCAILEDFALEGKNYMILCELQDDSTLGEEMFSYRYREDGEDLILDYIDDDDELIAVEQAYMEILKAAEIDEE